MSKIVLSVDRKQESTGRCPYAGMFPGVTKDFFQRPQQTGRWNKTFACHLLRAGTAQLFLFRRIRSHLLAVVLWLMGGT